jgi:hypothetical protein
VNDSPGISVFSRTGVPVLFHVTFAEDAVQTVPVHDVQSGIVKVLNLEIIHSTLTKGGYDHGTDQD